MWKTPGQESYALLIRLGPQPGAWSTGSSDIYLSNSTLSPFLLQQLAPEPGSRGGGSPWRRELGVQAGVKWRQRQGLGSRLDETASVLRKHKHKRGKLLRKMK